MLLCQKRSDTFSTNLLSFSYILRRSYFDW